MPLTQEKCFKRRHTAATLQSTNKVSEVVLFGGWRDGHDGGDISETTIIQLGKLCSTSNNRS